MTEQFGRPSFVFTKDGKPFRIVNADGTQIRIRTGSDRISKRCDQLIEEFDKLRETSRLRYLLTRLLKIYALSRELVNLLTEPSQREGRDMPFVYMKRGHFEFTDEFDTERLEGEHFQIIEVEPEVPPN